ncbi:MAG: helix-turn-helix transcriptional regulator [Bacteroidales bacterium]
MTTNNRLMEFMKEEGMSQIDLAKLIGVSRQNVNAWFTKGVTISDRMLIRIIEAIEMIDARWFLTGKPTIEIPKNAKTFTTRENYEIMLSKLMDSQRALGLMETENKYLRMQVGEL